MTHAVYAKSRSLSGRQLEISLAAQQKKHAVHAHGCESILIDLARTHPDE